MIKLLDASIADYNFFHPTTTSNPHPIFHQLRAENPVYWSSQLNGWVLTKYDDVISVLRSRFITPMTMTERLHLFPIPLASTFRPLRDCLALWMGHPTHSENRRMQRAFERFFTPDTVKRLRHQAKRRAKGLIKRVQPQNATDMVSEFIDPLSASMMAYILGLPSQDEARIKGWSDNIQALFDPFYDVEGLQQTQVNLQKMSHYLREMIRQRRTTPGDDLITVLIKAQDEGDLHHEDEIIANCMLLLCIGYQTATNLMNNGLLALLEHPQQLAKLKANPDLLPLAVEEMLRYDGPNQLLNRTAVNEVQINQTKIAAHETLFVMLSAANRDPAKFSRPDDFDITRKKNRHIAFGLDSFHCLGASIARMEAKACFSTLLHDLPTFQPNFEQPDWQAIHPLRRKLTSLPVLF